MPPDSDPLKNKRSPKLLATSFHFRKITFSSHIILLLLLAAVAGVEAFALYTYLYKNLTIEDNIGQEGHSGAVRINFENYQKVIGRLGRVNAYRAPVTIDFTYAAAGTGRENPFAEP